ncbi:MAG: PAS domain S-box protein [Rhodomicrobium sp.]
MAVALEGIAPETAILDAAGVIVFVNSAWVKFGVENASSDPGAYLGRNYVDVCLKSSLAGDTLAREALDGIRAVTAGALPSFGQKYPCHSREQERWFHMTVTRASTGSDIVIAHSDITQVVQAERGNAEAERRLMIAHERFAANRALEESEERFRKIVDSAIDAIVIIDEEGQIRSLNRAAERIFGYHRDEAVGSNVSIFMAEPHHMFQEAPANGDFDRSGTARVARTVEGCRKDGSKFPVKLFVAAWRAAGKRYFAGIVRTEFETAPKEAERRL